MNVPSWVTTSVGIYALVGSVVFLVYGVIAFVLLLILRDISIQVKNLTGKVEQLTDRVRGIADQVNAVTTEVGARTTGIVRMVDESAGGAIRILEVLAPVLVVFGAFIKLRNMAGGRHRRRR